MYTKKAVKNILKDYDDDYDLAEDVVENIMGDYDEKEEMKESRKGIPKMDGSGRGIRANWNRGRCRPKKRW